MTQPTVSACHAMDQVLKRGVVYDYVASYSLAQASIKVNGQWFEVQIQPRTEQEIIDTFGQAD